MKIGQNNKYDIDKTSGFVQIWFQLRVFDSYILQLKLLIFFDNFLKHFIFNKWVQFHGSLKLHNLMETTIHKQKSSLKIFENLMLSIFYISFIFAYFYYSILIKIILSLID
jgi:hypothetical protein